MKKVVGKLIFIRFVISVLFCLFLSPSVYAQKLNEDKVVLDNGLTVLLTEMPTSPVVSVYALIKTGSATEGKYLGSGITHLLEHMLFKRTKNRSEGQIATEIQAAGGYINAATSKDYTIYTITIPNDKVNIAIDVLSDMLKNSYFDKSEFEKERDVVYKEIKLGEDNPDREFNELIYDTVYINHPYEFPIIGYKELLSALTIEDLNDYYSANYIPNNAILSIAGGISIQELLPIVDAKFSDFKRKTPVVRNLPREPQQISMRSVTKSYPTNLTRAAMSFQSMGLNDSDLFAVDVLAQILGQGGSSRLYKVIKQEKELVYSINAFNSTPVDNGIFSIVFTLDKKNLDAVVIEILKEIENIKQKGVSADELKKSVTQVVAANIFSRQTSDQMAYQKAYEYAFTSDEHFSDNYVKSIKQVTNLQIISAANKYLNKNNLSLAVLEPESNSVENKIDSSSNFNENSKMLTLDNGLKVILSNIKVLPIVSINLVVNAGLMQEPEYLNGISNLTADLMVGETKSKDPNKLNEYVESNGISLDSFSGKNSMGISISCLSQDFDKSLDLLYELITEQQFSQKQIDKTKKVVDAIIKSKNDDIYSYSNNMIKKEMFPDHPYGNDSEGTSESLKNISREDIKKFFNKSFIPGNMVISIVGDIEMQKISENIDNKFSKLKMDPINLKIFEPVSIGKEIKKTINLEKQQAMVQIGFIGPDIKAEDKYDVEVLTAILGSSFNGRLFAAVREKLGQAYSLSGGYVPGINTGYIVFYVLTSKEYVDKIEEILKSQFVDIQKNGVSESELADMKSYLKGIFKKSNQTNNEIGFNFALNELYGLGYDYYNDYDKFIDSVTVESIKKAALKYLNVSQSVVLKTLPAD